MSETEGLFRLSLLAAASGNAKLCQSPFCCLASLLSSSLLSRDSKDSCSPFFTIFNAKAVSAAARKVLHSLTRQTIEVVLTVICQTQTYIQVMYSSAAAVSKPYYLLFFLLLDI